MIKTSKQRSYLKGLAMNLEPIFQIGKSSLTPQLTAAVSEALAARELIKISVLQNCTDDPRELAQLLAERTRSEVVQVIERRLFFIKRAKIIKENYSPVEVMKVGHLKKTGVLGGTFNPIHTGHLVIAENARDEFKLDEVLIMPAHIPPHKRPHIF